MKGETVKAQFPSFFFSTNMGESQMHMDVSNGEKTQYGKMPELSFRNYDFGKRSKVSLEFLNFQLPRVGRKPL